MKLSKKILSLCCVGFVASAIAAHADTLTFDATGTSAHDGAVSGQAVFVTSAGQIQISLSNLLSASSIVSVGEAVSDLSFTVDGVSCNFQIGTPQTPIAAGQEGNVSSGKVTYTSGTPDHFVGQGGQGSYTVSGQDITLEALGGSQPDQLILPYMASGGTYSSLNNGASAHNPYTIGPAVFTLDFNNSGITANTTISDVNISFGTSSDETVICATPVPNVTPEPSSLLLLGTGIIGAAGLLRRRMISNQG